MAIQVPTFDDPMNQVKPEALPGARVAVGSPADAFGAGPSAEKAQNAGMGAAKALTDYATQQRDVADQVAHIQADTQASQLQTKIQVDISKMRGQDAFQAPDYADQKWKDGISQIQDGLTGQTQKTAFAKTSSQRYDDLNKSVQYHVATESQNFYDQTTQSGIDQFRNAAVVNAGDSAQVSQALDGQEQLVAGWAKRKGIPQDSEIYKDKLTTEMSATNLGVVHARLQSGLDDAAQKYFDENKSNMSAADVMNAENALDSSKVIGEASDIFDDVMSKPGFKDSQGMVNGEAVRKYVMDQTDSEMSDQRKLRVTGLVKAQVAEYNRDRLQQLSANERDFANEAIAGRKNNDDLQDAMKLATKWGHDDYDIQNKEKFIQGLYDTPTETKVITHEQLREGIQSGAVDFDDIDRAQKMGLINAGDWAELRQLKFKTAADGTDPQTEYTDGLIKALAQKTMGNDKQQMARFQYVLNKQAYGKSPDEKLAIAKDELQRVPDANSIYFWTSIEKYKVDFQKQESQQVATGLMYHDIGFQQAQAIGSGISGTAPGRPQNPAANVQAFANTLGVKYEDMKIGTPVNNAIRSLQIKNKNVTPGAVQKVLQNYPDGRWAPGLPSPVARPSQSAQVAPPKRDASRDDRDVEDDERSGRDIIIDAYHGAMGDDDSE